MNKNGYKKLYKVVYEFAHDVYVVKNDYSEKEFNAQFTGWNVPKDIKDVYRGFIASAQNGAGMSKIINFHKREKQIKKILFNYDVKRILKSYDQVSLFSAFDKTFIINNKKSKGNKWKQYSQSCIDSAVFLSKFNTLKEFDNFVNCFNKNEHTRVALPLYLSSFIKGMGFALACDVLKEFNYTNYAKPDTHTIDFFTELVIVKSENNLKKDDIKIKIDVFNEMQKMAAACNETPFKIDKIIWLSCARDYGGHKKELINKCKRYINNNS